MRNILILLHKDWRCLVNLRHLMRDQSLFKVAFILFFAAGMLLGLFGLFLEGFWFLDTLGGIGLASQAPATYGAGATR